MATNQRQPEPLHIETELSRDLGLTSALAIGIGTMIAAGIFTLSGLAVREVGSAAIVSFLLAAIVAMFTALTYCEFVSIYPESGEGYLYVRRTLKPPFAYFVGWALFLGYTSSCGFYMASFSSYFHEFIWAAPFKSAAGVLGLIALVMINVKGTKESGIFQIVITLAKVLLLIWFVVGGLGSVRSQELIDRFNSDVAKIGSTTAMVFITFFGFSAIAASAGEVKNPTKTIPLAILISMSVVVVVYTMVVLVIIAAGLSEYTESAMGNAARQFLGPIGGMVIVAGALFSMISASNASIMAGSRVTLSMSRLGHFPKGVGSVSAKTRTPIIALLLVGGTILIFSISMELEDLAHFANTVLLVALSMVNMALIVHRRKFPNMERPFRVPLVPLLPALGILANLYLLSQIMHHPGPMLKALGCLALGFGGFVIWRGTKAGEGAMPGAPSRIALEQSTTTGEHRFRVLVPLANPKNVAQLIDIASAIASERDGELVTMRVALVPEQLPPSRESSIVERERTILENAHSLALSHDVPVSSLVRVGHNAARAILETAKQRNCDLIVMGWKGYTTTTKKILGETVDAVVNHAQCDIMLVKQTTHEPLRRFLLPTAGGEHARCAEQYIASLVRAREGSMTITSVAQPDAPPEQREGVKQRLDEAIQRIKATNHLDVQSKVIEHKSIPVGIIEEAKQDYDALVLGASGESIYPQILFGSIPETIAKRCDKTVIMVKHYHPVKALLGRVVG
ncbi:MAG: amino acid permease, partial [Planctomycetota bacterium]|nr:amino acid permease [Planctomycetota bacterium]